MEQETEARKMLAELDEIAPPATRGSFRAELMSAQLQNALNSRVLVEQAKGVLAE